MHENKEEGRGFSRYHLRYGYKKTDRDRFVPRLNLLRLAMTQVFCCYGRTRLATCRHSFAKNAALVLRLRRVFRFASPEDWYQASSPPSKEIYFGSFKAFIHLCGHCSKNSNLVNFEIRYSCLAYHYFLFDLKNEPNLLWLFLHPILLYTQRQIVYHLKTCTPTTIPE